MCGRVQNKFTRCSLVGLLLIAGLAENSVFACENRLLICGRHLEDELPNCISFYGLPQRIDLLDKTHQLQISDKLLSANFFICAKVVQFINSQNFLSQFV